MRLVTCIIALIAALSVTSVSAQGPVLGQQGSMGAPASYTGPGDVISGAKAGYSFRAWTSASRGSNAVRVCNSGDAACVDMVTHATTGDLVITTVGGTDCSVSTCTVRTLYDQSGALGCTSSTACDAVQATEANRPIFKTSCTGGKPCMQCTATSSQMLSNSSFVSATSQTFSAMFVANRTSTTSTNTALGMNGTSIQLGFNNAANAIRFFAGSSSVAATSIADNSFHAVAAKFAGASSALYAEGSSVATGSPGGSNTGTNLGLCATPTAANFTTGLVAEAGFWAGDQSASFGSLSSNQHSYYGF